MVLLHLRITDDSRERLIEVMLWLRSESKVYMSVLECGSITGKQHTHNIIDSPITKSGFSQQFLRKFPRYKGNKSYSLAPLKKELENNNKYCCKGRVDCPPDVLFSVYTEEQINEFHIEYWEINKVCQKKKAKTQKAYSWSEELTAQIRRDFPDAQWSYCAMDIRQLMGIVRDALGATSKKLSSKIIHELILGQLNALNSECRKLESNLMASAFPDLFEEYNSMNYNSKFIKT